LLGKTVTPLLILGNTTKIALPKAYPAGAITKVPSNTQPPVAEIPPQPMQLKPPIKKTSPVLCSGRGISQNKNPNIGLNLKSGIEIIPNTKNIDKLSENLRNISNMIGNPIPIQSAPKPMPSVTKPEASTDSPTQATEESLTKTCEEHEKLVNLILEEEEEVVKAHKQQIDEVVEMVKHQMKLLQELDKPGSDADAYANSLDETLENKLKVINSLREKLAVFRTHLKQEKELSKKFLEQQNALETKNAMNNQKEAANDIVV